MAYTVMQCCPLLENDRVVASAPSIARHENIKETTACWVHKYVAGLNATRTCQDRLVITQIQCLAHEPALSWGAVWARASLLKRMHD